MYNRGKGRSIMDKFKTTILACCLAFAVASQGYAATFKTCYEPESDDAVSYTVYSVEKRRLGIKLYQIRCQGWKRSILVKIDSSGR